MSGIMIVGLAAAFLTSFAGLPQAIKTLKTRKTRDLSLGMYIFLTLGVILWVIYGIIKKDIPVIMANILALIFISPVVALVILNRVKRER